MLFKINYKGTSCRGTLFIYKCPNCQWEQEESHPAAEDPEIKCTSCLMPSKKKITAPALDADLHDGMLTRNKGWPLDAEE